MEGFFSANSLGWAKSVDIMSKTNMLSNERKAEFRYYSEREKKKSDKKSEISRFKRFSSKARDLLNI